MCENCRQYEYCASLITEAVRIADLTKIIFICKTEGVIKNE
jgi:hypothetical protein